MVSEGENRPTTWTFIAPALPRPAGGLVAMFEVANELATRTAHRVGIVHLPTTELPRPSPGQLAWFDFDSSVAHHFADTLNPSEIPPADIVVVTPMTVALAAASDEHLESPLLAALRQGTDLGLPLVLVQGLSVLPSEIEKFALELPGPKICVGTALTDAVVDLGVRPHRAVHIPNGLDHHTFNVVRAIEDRRPMVTMSFDPHPVKGGDAGFRALRELHARSGTPALAFGTRVPEQPTPDGTSFVLSPARATIATEIYNHASLYLQPSRREGFGLAAVEAMACGCALVTTDNGGARDYALDGETALVCGLDPEEMVEALARLVADDGLRTRLARNGAAFVEAFRWEATADGFARLAADYLVDPDRYGTVVA